MNPHDNKARDELKAQQKAAASAILVLMKDESNDHLFVRGILERLIEKIEARLEALTDNQERRK